ncbi:MAG TPA: DUF3999 family protein, partial [Cellvibrionaceae bacterium]|nr:DUF3999 family protein [Cellvibrionaceae bacterium]
MNKITRPPGLCALFLLFSAITAQAGTTPLFQINAEPGTFIQVPLTHQVYQFNPPSDAAFVVLDGKQNSLPSIMSAPSPNNTEPSVQIRSQQLAFFAVPAETSTQALRQVLSTQNQVLNYGSKQISQHIETQDTLSTNTPDFYLIDLRNLEQGINALIIDWDNKTQNSFLQVQVDASNNLQDWQKLTQASLVQVQEQEQSLIHNRIPVSIAKQAFAYLRLSLMRGAEQLHIQKISAEERLYSAPPQELPQEHWSLAGTLAKEQTSLYRPSSQGAAYPVRAFEFSRDESTPAEFLALNLGMQTYADRLRVLSRTEARGQWELIYQGIWFNTQMGEEWQTSAPIKLGGNRAQFWRLEFAAQQAIDAPELLFSWHPTQLQFIANNAPPFVLGL